MSVDASSCLVVEDSLVGVIAGKAANMQVVAVPSIQSDSDQFSVADFVIHSFLDFQPEIWGLPPFDDWVMKALPIEPIHFTGSYKNGSLQEISDNGASDLPGQVWGVYFGWVDIDLQERIKIVVSIRWDTSCGSFDRNMQACFINGSNVKICDQPMEVALVGYIRGFSTKSLERCQLNDVVSAKPGKLDSAVVDNGDNWSVGQRQLLCLGRVMLKHSRLLFMDEATASVDSRCCHSENHPREIC